MLTVQTERAVLLDDMVRAQAANIQYNNERLKEFNTAMSLANQYGELDGNLHDIKMEALNLDTGEIERMSVQSFLDSRKVSMPEDSKKEKIKEKFKKAFVEGMIGLSKGNYNVTVDKASTPDADSSGDTYSKEEIGIIVNNIKNSVDSLTSSSQLDMTQLQSTMNRYNQTFDALTNFIAKYNQALSSVIGNLR